MVSRRETVAEAIDRILAEIGRTREDDLTVAHVALLLEQTRKGGELWPR